MNYYNEYDPHAAAWLRQLIADGQIPNGVVDDRSIVEVSPSDLSEYTQCHFFAGIGGWSRALDLAKWDRERSVWTASLPCQPFSSAGKQAGTSDERHLWPVFQRLVRECRPTAIFGEQVASKIAREEWFPGVCMDLQAMGYPVTAVDLCAPCAGEDGEGRLVRGDQESWEPIVIGAPHIRQRLYWVAYRGVADTFSGGQRGRDQRGLGTGREQMAQQEDGANAPDEPSDGRSDAGGTSDHRMAQPRNDGAGSQPRTTSGLGGQPVDTGTTGLRQDHGTACSGGVDPRSAGGDAVHRMADTPSDRRERAGQGAEAEEGRQPRPEHGGELPCGYEGRGLHSGLADTYLFNDDRTGLGAGDDGGQREGQEELCGQRDRIRLANTSSAGREGRVGSRSSGEEGQPNGYTGERGGNLWSDFDLIPCRDGKARRVESGVKPLVAGLPRGVVPSCDPSDAGYANETAEARVMRLKGYGNAICAPLAAMFIESSMGFLEIK